MGGNGLLEKNFRLPLPARLRALATVGVDIQLRLTPDQARQLAQMVDRAPVDPLVVVVERERSPSWIDCAVISLVVYSALLQAFEDLARLIAAGLRGGW